jgi:hypothetical protein
MHNFWRAGVIHNLLSAGCGEQKAVSSVARHESNDDRAGGVWFGTNC